MMNRASESAAHRRGYPDIALLLVGCLALALLGRVTRADEELLESLLENNEAMCEQWALGITYNYSRERLYYASETGELTREIETGKVRRFGPYWDYDRAPTIVRPDSHVEHLQRAHSMLNSEYRTHWWHDSPLIARIDHFDITNFDIIVEGFPFRQLDRLPHASCCNPPGTHRTRPIATVIRDRIARGQKVTAQASADIDGEYRIEVYRDEGDQTAPTMRISLNANWSFMVTRFESFDVEGEPQADLKNEYAFDEQGDLVPVRTDYVVFGGSAIPEGFDRPVRFRFTDEISDFEPHHLQESDFRIESFAWPRETIIGIERTLVSGETIREQLADYFPKQAGPTPGGTASSAPGSPARAQPVAHARRESNIGSDYASFRWGNILWRAGAGLAGLCFLIFGVRYAFGRKK